MKKLAWNTKKLMGNLVWLVLGMILMLVILNLRVEITPQYDHYETTINGTLLKVEDKLVEIDYDVLWDDSIVVSF